MESKIIENQEYQWVRGSRRQRPYARHLAKTIRDPSPLQAAQRLRLSRASFHAYGTKGIMDRPDGSRIPMNAAVISPVLKGSPVPETLSSYPLTPALPIMETRVLYEQDRAQVDIPLTTEGMKDIPGAHDIPLALVAPSVELVPQGAEAVPIDPSLDAPIPTPDSPIEPFPASNFWNRFFVSGINVCAELIDRKIAVLNMTAPTVVPKTLSAPRVILNQKGDKMYVPINPVNPQANFQAKYDMEFARLSAQLQQLRNENTQLRQQSLTRVAHPVQQVYIRKQAKTPTDFRHKYGFMG